MHFKAITITRIFELHTSLLVCSFLFAIIVNVNISIAEIKILDSSDFKILNILIKNSGDTSPFQIFYFLKKDFCYNCVSAELKAGWFDSPNFMKRYLNINFATNIKQFSRYLKDIEKSEYKIIAMNLDSSNTLNKYFNTAIFYDINNQVAYQYKPSSKDFSKIYRYFDSVICHSQSYDIKLNSEYKIDSTEIPYYVNQLKITYEPYEKNLYLYSSKEATLWIYNLLGNLIKKVNLYRADELERIKIDSTRYIYNNLIKANDTLYTNALLLSNPIDTVVFNRSTRRWRKVNQELHIISENKGKYSVDSIVKFNNQTGTFVKSINSNTIWGVFYLMNKDTIHGKFNLFYSLNNRINLFELPLEYYSGNPEFCCSYDNKLYTINPYGKLIIIDTNRKTSSYNVSYYQNNRRINTFYDGNFFSITSNNGDYSYLTVYNSLGLRCFNFNNHKSNAYYLYLSKENKIIEIIQDPSTNANWKIISYNI